MAKKSFTEKEVREKLEQLGYGNVPKEKMHVFLKDLDELIKYENAKGYNSSSYITEEDEYEKSFEKANLPIKTSDKERQNISSNSMFYSGDKENISFKQDFPVKEHDSPSFTSESSYSISDTLTSSICKRKVARKRDGKFHVFDETFTENESTASDITVLEEKLRALPLKDSRNENDIRYHDDDEQDDTNGSLTSENISSTRQFLPSYIRTSTVQPHLRRIKKTDPVNRYHQFKEEWKVQRVPGESKDNSLRWNVREKMLNYEKFERPKHSHKPNNYEVPTGKKRQTLRWEVRSALARI